jgi:hypothetical protein
MNDISAARTGESRPGDNTPASSLAVPGANAGDPTPNAGVGRSARADAWAMTRQAARASVRLLLGRLSGERFVSLIRAPGLDTADRHSDARAWRDLLLHGVGNERLEDDLFVPHDKRVGADRKAVPF